MADMEVARFSFDNETSSPPRYGRLRRMNWANTTATIITPIRKHTDTTIAIRVYPRPPLAGSGSLLLPIRPGLVVVLTSVVPFSEVSTDVAEVDADCEDVLSNVVEVDCEDRVSSVV